MSELVSIRSELQGGSYPGRKIPSQEELDDQYITKINGMWAGNDRYRGRRSVLLSQNPVNEFNIITEARDLVASFAGVSRGIYNKGDKVENLIYLQGRIDPQLAAVINEYKVSGRFPKLIVDSLTYQTGEQSDVVGLVETKYRLDRVGQMEILQPENRSVLEKRFENLVLATLDNDVRTSLGDANRGIQDTIQFYIDHGLLPGDFVFDPLIVRQHFAFGVDILHRFGEFVDQQLKGWRFEEQGVLKLASIKHKLSDIESYKLIKKEDIYSPEDVVVDRVSSGMRRAINPLIKESIGGKFDLNGYSFRQMAKKFYGCVDDALNENLLLPRDVFYLEESMVGELDLAFGVKKDKVLQELRTVYFSILQTKEQVQQTVDIYSKILKGKELARLKKIAENRLRGIEAIRAV